MDILLKIGTASSQYPLDDQLIFGAGAVPAVDFWFFALACGTGRLAHLFHHLRVWQTLDAVCGCIMLGMTGSLGASWLM